MIKKQQFVSPSLFSCVYDACVCCLARYSQKYKFILGKLVK